MTKLHQLIAVAKGKKARSQSVMTESYQRLQKPELFAGMSRKYRPKDEEGEVFPSEEKRVTYTAKKAVEDFRQPFIDALDITATIDAANLKATADVVVNGVVVLKGVSVMTLLYLEKRLEDLHTFVNKLPVLSSTEEWTYSEEQALYKTRTRETRSTKKTPRVITKAEATEHHPAQTELYYEDVTQGHWEQTDYSGAVDATTKARYVKHVQQLIEAVKVAREEANGAEATDVKVGEALVNFVFA